MARRPRIDLAGYHHIVNRGVERRKVFLDKEDYTTFLKIVCEVCIRSDVTLHSYCLMSNHYHLLIETSKEDLSKVMRAINAEYAAYFNRKHKRVGHLWQGRFKSWFVTDEAYLYTLVKYIEYNPVKAKIVDSLDAYPYCSYQAFSEREEPIVCLKKSIMFTQFESLEDRMDLFDGWYDEDVMREIAKASRLVVSSVPTQRSSQEELIALFAESQTKKERDQKVMKAIKVGYSQQDIANVIGISQPAVSQIVKKNG